MRHNLMNTDLVTVNMSLKRERLIKNSTYIILQVQDNLISDSVYVAQPFNPVAKIIRTCSLLNDKKVQ